jgi:hypothetical protein
MNVDALALLRDLLLAAGSLALVVAVLWKLAVWARTRARGAYVLGTLFSPFMGLGNVVDPDFRVVNESKRLKQKEDDDPGDPPSSEDDSAPQDPEGN